MGYCCLKRLEYMKNVRWMICVVCLVMMMPLANAQDSTSVKERPKVGLVLSGGGAKGAAHVGVLKYLEDNGIPIDYIAGSYVRTMQPILQILTFF